MPWQRLCWWAVTMGNVSIAVPGHAVLLADVLQLCTELLGVPAGSLEASQNFFEHGGNSLKALQLCVQLEHRHPPLWGEAGIDLTLIVATASFTDFVSALLASARQASLPCASEGEL